MAGTVRGKIDCLVNTGNQWDNHQNIFKLIYDFLKLQLEPAGVVTEIARWGGNGSSPTSTDFHDGASPFRSAAFCVFRWNPNGSRTWPWYMLVQWSRGDQTNFGTSNSAPALLNASSSFGFGYGMIGVQAAIGVGGDENPWKGTGSIGSSVKATPVWGAPTGGSEVIVLPRSNNSGGSHNTNKENCCHVYNVANDGRPIRVHLLADEDSFLFLGDLADTGFYATNYTGLLTPIAGLTHPYPMLQFEYPLYVPTAGVYGITTGGANNGGIVMPSAVSGARVRSAHVSRLDEFLHTQPLMGPNMISGTYDEFPLAWGTNETVAHAGLVGFTDQLIREVTAPQFAVNTTKTRATFGHNTYNTGVQSDRYQKFSVPWDGVNIPRSNFTRNGYTF